MKLTKKLKEVEKKGVFIYSKVPCKKAGLLLILGLMSFTLLQQEKTTIYLVGDSTMSNKSIRSYPETGWGMPFQYYWDDDVTVDNRAKNGRSTRTFIEEGRWKSIMQTLKAGDWVIVQFGHNDEVPSKGSYTPPKQFKANLLKFLKDTRSKEAHPILLTPVTRRKFDSLGNVVDTHVQYSKLVKEVAAKYQVPLIDLDSLSIHLIQKLGPKGSQWLWLNLKKGENPHYPNGRHDNTHFNELGARKMAELVLKGIEKLKLPLAKRISFR